MTEVVVKGEIHTSRSDVDEERNLLVEGADALVLEGQAKEAEYRIRHGWFAIAMKIVSLVMFRHLYADHRLLGDLADAQGAKRYSTRQSDAELIENASPVLEFGTAILFYILFCVSIIYGLYGHRLYGAAFLFGAAAIPVIILRIHESKRKSDNINRDKIMADLVSEAAEDADRVVAIFGGAHVDAIVENLPSDLDPEVRPPAYKIFSWQHLKEIFTPAFGALSVLFVLYLVILWVMRWALIHF